MTFMRRLMPLILTVALSTVARAAPTYTSGHITNVTFGGDFVMIILDAPLPDNCAGVSYGWMTIPAQNKPMIAFVIGLWMRGDAASTMVTVYTDALVGGVCRINQLDPAG